MTALIVISVFIVLTLLAYSLCVSAGRADDSADYWQKLAIRRKRQELMEKWEGLELESCKTCKHHEEQPYTGYFPPTPVYCKHPENKGCVFTLRHSVCEKWEGK